MPITILTELDTVIARPLIILYLPRSTINVFYGSDYVLPIYVRIDSHLRIPRLDV
jgi:hypothetical protein